MNRAQLNKYINKIGGRMTYSKTHNCYYIDRIDPVFVPTSTYWTGEGLNKATKQDIWDRFPKVIDEF